MSKLLLLLLFQLALSGVPDGMKLVWSDEFDGANLDGSKWVCETGTGSGGWGNNELEYYTDRKENVYLADSCLHIHAQRENMGDKQYTSARIKTQGKYTFTYGYVEARMKIPRSTGIWPAFWMLGENINQVSWPACGELDIMEAINTEGKVYGTCHWDSNGYATYGTSSGVFDITQFHVYSLKWDREYIRVAVDDQQYYEILIKDSTGGTGAFHKPMFFILNVAVGGNWPGFNVDNGALPQELVVDYVRVYQ